MRNFSKGFDGVIETFRSSLNFSEGALGLGKGVNQLSKLDLHKGNVEFEMYLRSGDRQGTARIIEGGLHGGSRLVLFAFEKPYAAKTSKNLRIRGAISVEGSFVLDTLRELTKHGLRRREGTHALYRFDILLQLAVNMTEVDEDTRVTNSVSNFHEDMKS